MATKKGAWKDPDEMSRPEKRGPPGRAPLVLIAGLPKETSAIVAATINNDKHLLWRAIATRFPPNDHAIYSDPDAILALGRAGCGISLEDKVDEEGVPTPSRIAVAYVDAPDSGALWDVFGHSGWPLVLRHPDWGYPGGRHWRHDTAVTGRVIREALRRMEAQDADAIRLRLEAQRNDDALLLPGRNFHLPNDGRLIERFRAFVAGEIDIAAIEADIRSERFAFERLPGFYKATGGKSKSFAIDARDLVFARSAKGQHGGQHALPADAGLGTVQRMLEARYRFGTPFARPGFQHDAQWEKDVPLKNEPFECAAAGAVLISGTHANIYPSDVITAPTVAQIK